MYRRTPEKIARGFSNSYPRPAAFYWWLLLLWIFSSLPGWASSGLQLFSDPPELRADSQSTAVIVAQVQDDTGAMAKDGTMVNFSTTLGSITPLAETRGGVARAVLTSGTAAGTAIVSAMVGEVRTDLEVDFIAATGEALPAFSLLKLEGKEVIYYRDARMAVLNQGGRFEYGGMVVTASCLQCNLAEGRLTAQGEVEISNGRERLTADALVLQCRRGRGSLLCYEGEEAAVYSLSTSTLKSKREALVPDPPIMSV